MPATTDERIYTAAINKGMPPVLSTLIVAQARHETGNYTSNVFLTCNNCFGYKYVGQNSALGPCTGSPEGNDYAKYYDIEQSVSELVGWIKRRQQQGKFPADLTSITTPDEYAQLLRNAGYYGSPLQTYINGLISALQRMGNTLTSTGGIAAIVIILALGLYIFRKKIFG